jgi:hypothetical protein
MTAELYSIQGEQIALDADLFMDQAEVDKFVDGLSPELAACREGRHDIPPMSASRLEFAKWNKEYRAFERHITCTRCGCYTRVELWEPFKRAGQQRWRKIGNAAPRYHENDRGETYTAPAGHGRISPRQIQEALATNMLQGTSPAQLRMALGRAGKRT